MRRFRPSFFVFCIAILGSLCVHLPVYTVLGKLADVLLQQEEVHKPAPPIEFEIEALQDVAKPAPEQRAEDNAPNLVRPAPSKPPVEDKLPQPQVAKEDAPKPKPNLNILPPPPAPPSPAAPPPEEMPNKLAVTQKSEDPSVPPPDDAKFIADENRRVAEETIASVTNLDTDDQPQLKPQKSSQDEAQGQGDEESRPADLHDHDGEQTRAPTEQEAKAEPPRPSEASKGAENAPAMANASLAGGAPGAEHDRHALAAGSQAVGGEDEAVVIDDGMGRIVVRRSLAGRGEGNEGGQAQRGASTAERAERAGARAGDGSNLRLSFSQFESAFGVEQLKEQRESYLAQRRSKSEGGSREVEWKKFRSAIENFVPNVKPGNQTALNAAASPFAAYLAEIHRLIHREFAMRFLRDLPLVGGPYNDYSLFTKLEIAINGDGTLHKIGVVQTSGYMPYDFGAWNAVERAAPFPQPPSKILSGDGRAYVRWGFYRNERQCGTFNAEPYILPNPPGTPTPPPNPLHDEDPGDTSKFGALQPARAGVVASAAAEQPSSAHAWTH